MERWTRRRTKGLRHTYHGVFYFFKREGHTVTCELRPGASGSGYDIIIVEPGQPVVTEHVGGRGAQALARSAGALQGRRLVGPDGRALTQVRPALQGCTVEASNGTTPSS
jgi:hypothetical protein